MIDFNELRISPDEKFIYIDVSIKDEIYWQDFYLDKIQVVKGEYSASGPGEDFPNKTKTYPIEGNMKRISMSIPFTDFGTFRDIFFVYVTAKLSNGGRIHLPVGETVVPCYKLTYMATVANTYAFFRQAMNYVKELGHTCRVPQNFIDYFLKFKALDLSIKTGNYTDAVNYYNQFFKNISNNPITNIGCGCSS